MIDRMSARLGRHWPLWLAAAVLALYQYSLWTLARNVGYADDLVDALWFFEIWREAPHGMARLASLLLPNHEHITLFNHLVYLLHYALTGTLNFLAFILYGQVALLALAWLLARWAQRYLDAGSAWLLAVALVFNLYYWHASFFAMTALSNQFVLAFALAGCALWARNPQALWPPVLAALAASATQFNGLLLLPVILVAALYRHGGGQPWHRQQWGLWLVLALGLIALYLCYESPTTLNHLERQIAATDSDKLHEFTRHEVIWQENLQQQLAELSYWQYGTRLLIGMLAVMGATVWPKAAWALWPAAATGAAMFAGLIFIIWRRDGWRDHFWLAAVGFIMASLLLVAIGRAMPMGVALMLESRYRINGFVLLALILAPLLAGWRPLYLRGALVLLAVGLALLGAWSQRPLIAQEVERISDSYRYWLIDGGLGRSQMPAYPHNQDRRLFKALDAGYYSVYDGVAAAYKPARIESSTEACPELAVVEQEISAFSRRPQARAVALQLELPPSAGGDWLWLCSANGGVRLLLGAAQHDPQQARYLPQLVLKTVLPPTDYRVYVRPVADTAAWQPIGSIVFR